MKHSYLKNAAVITLGGLAAKGIGALYRIPLMGILGGYGMGLYQMAYPLFCVLLTFSSAGIPSAFSRLVARETARGREGGQTVRAALRLFASLGALGSAAMALLAPYMAKLQGDGNLVFCYLALAPSVFLVALIAVFRGYFQGKNDMAPTAASEIAEQVVKACLGLFFAYRYQNDPQKAVSYTLFAVTLSEVAALGLLALRYRLSFRPVRTLLCRTTGSDILAAALPVMAATALLPLSHTVDSVLIVRLLSVQTARAVSLYGLFAGGAVALVNLPATVCYGLAAASVPVVSAHFARGEEAEGRRAAVRALAFTLVLAVPCALALFFLARPVSALLYPSLGAEDLSTLVFLVRLSSVSCVTLAGTDTLAACLTGMGRARRAAMSMLVAVTVKFVLQIVLIPDPRFGIAGAAVAANVCYLIAFLLDLVYTVKKGKRRERYDHDRGARLKAGRPLPDGAESIEGGGRSVRADKRALIR